MPDILQKERFLQIEAVQVPLEQVPYEKIRQNITDPTTGKPYNGIVLEGIFADLNNSKANNNMRFYDIPSYLEMVDLLHKQIHSKKGVYGELEHPKGYAVNYNNVSHKIIDIWYNFEEKKVYGQVLILDTPKGKIVQEIIRSGGQVGISARAAGEEIINKDGTKSATTKLLTTYDLVYHPGFSSALMGFKELNESQKELYAIGKQKIGFSGIIYEKDLKKLPERYAEYIELNESTNCFFEWYFKNLNESQNQEQKADEKTMEDNETDSEDDYQNKLKLASEKDLSEKNNFFQQLENSQKDLRTNLKNKKSLKSNQGKSYYDNSAGFISNDQTNKQINKQIHNPYKLSSEIVDLDSGSVSNSVTE